MTTNANHSIQHRGKNEEEHKNILMYWNQGSLFQLTIMRLVLPSLWNFYHLKYILKKKKFIFLINGVHRRQKKKNLIVNPIFSHRGDIFLRISTGISAVTVSTSPSPSPPSPLCLLLYCCFFKVCSNKSSLSLFDSSASPSSSPSPPLPSQVKH